MKYHCPHCSNLLANTVEQPMREKLLGEVHVGYGRFVVQVATAQIMGDCPLHGVVITEKVVMQILKDMWDNTLIRFGLVALALGWVPFFLLSKAVAALGS